MKEGIRLFRSGFEIKIMKIEGLNIWFIRYLFRYFVMYDNGYKNVILCYRISCGYIRRSL